LQHGLEVVRVFQSVLWGALSLAVAGCDFETADYSGTRFTCVEPPYTCPPGYTCDSGECRPEFAPADAGVTADVAYPADTADASSLPPADAPPRADASSPLDASPPTPDADPPDAGPPVVITFGEGAADVQGVTADTWLSEDDPYWTYGDSYRICVDNSPNEAGLLRFDLSAIPTDALVLAAELEVVVHEELESGDAVAFALAEEWDEDTATWEERVEGIPWTDTGAGVDSQAPGLVAIFTPSALDSYTVDLDVNTVQAWVADPQSNFGIAWFSTSPDGHGFDFYSSDETLSSLRPLLRVTYR